MQQKIRTLQAQLGDQKGKREDTLCVSDTLDPLSQKLENENVELDFKVLNYAKENAHLKTTCKNFSSKKNQRANVLKSANQKKNKANIKKSKKLGSKDSLASTRPSKPRTCLRRLPTRRIFDLFGKITTPNHTESEFDTSVCDNASASNPQEPTSKGFPNSTSFLDKFTRLWRQNTSIYPLAGS
ncbi:hypothetical protein Tco_1499673 [Tanacetum coccineum]